MKIYIGSDHAGYRLKERVITYLEKDNLDYKDMGCYSEDSVHYPDYAIKVMTSMEKIDIGILVCKTGIGMSIVANKFKGIRAALCYNKKVTKLTREHNDSNVLCLGADYCKNVESIIKTFLETEFSNESKHRIRIGKIINLEKTI